MLKHKKWLAFIVLLPFIFLFLKAGTAQSQSSANYTLKKDVVDMGGAPAQSANYQLVDAVAQSGGIGAALSSSYRESSGFFSEGEVSVNPTLSVSPTTLDFGTTDDSKTFQISNTGTGTLTWTVTQSQNKPWITSISPISGSDDATVTVTVDRSQMSGNDDTGTLIVASNGGSQNVTVNISKASSGNLLVNGDFSDGNNGWWLYVHESASATGSVENGEYHVSISNGGSEDWHIQLGQSDLLIENGKQYDVSFEAYAASPRQISPSIKRGGNGPWLGYHDYQSFSLSTTKQTYSYSFVMNEATDNEAIFYIDVGNSTADVYFDNMTILVGDGSVGIPIYPNTSNTQTIGSEFWVDIIVGDNANPVTDLKIISLELDFTNTSIVDYLTYEIGSFLTGAQASVIPDDPNGKISASVYKTSGGNSGVGTVLRLKFQVLDSATPGQTICFSIGAVQANSSTGETIVLSPSAPVCTEISAGLSVWPGDANNDGVVSIFDINSIVAIYWEKTGPTRPNASMQWVDQPCPSWNPQAATYADCNGDGIVNIFDINAVIINFGKTHSRMTGLNLSDAENTLADPPIYLEERDYDPTSQEFWIDVIIGSASDQVSDLRVVSFELTYTNTANIDYLSYEQGSFMPEGQATVLADDANGKISASMYQTSGSSSGHGILLSLKFKAATGVQVEFDFAGVLANSSDGSIIPITPIGKTLVTKVAISNEKVITDYSLQQNYPNPFNPETTIEYHLPRASHVEIAIFNLQGQRIVTLVDKHQSAGSFQINWNGKNQESENVASGIYVYQLKAGDFILSKKMMFLR
ncbi:MAG: T9SS type A sorting domain-containing protein [Calditrichaeota bacterium]|nr:T9SS type A sorting domain-containing protein [Calditrichota bacterium]